MLLGYYQRQVKSSPVSDAMLALIAIVHPSKALDAPLHQEHLELDRPQVPKAEDRVTMPRPENLLFNKLSNCRSDVSAEHSVGSQSFDLVPLQKAVAD